MKMTEIPRIFVGVDLHKQQFTVHAINEETVKVMLTGIYRTDIQGYSDFCKKNTKSRDALLLHLTTQTFYAVWELRGQALNI